MIAQVRPIRHNFLSGPEELINEARNGRMFILVDDEDRENEGDLIIPAQMATPDAINFMATHGRGLICLAITPQRAEELDLGPMVRENGAQYGTAFTASIEAREGITTGISAADRARTVATAIDATNGPDRIVSPGHVFPLIAREGGVLMRTGHTEAAVDIARLAGLNPSGVICEVMKDDGTMARLDDLVTFAQRHNLKIGTIRDLIAYRLRHDHNVEKIAELTFTSRFGGEWRAITYRNKAVGSENLALVKGRIDPTRPTLVRMHTHSIFADMLAEDAPRTGLLEGAMRQIADAGCGVVVLINRAHHDHMSRIFRVRAGIAPHAEKEEFRDYGIGAQVLAELGIHEMVLLTNSRHTMVALAGYGLNVVEERPIRKA